VRTEGLILASSLCLWHGMLYERCFCPPTPHAWEHIQMAVSLALQAWRYVTTPRSHAPDEALYMGANVHNHGMRGRG
jgi:hypothetical protein